MSLSQALNQFAQNLGRYPANGLVRILHISDHQWSTAARFSSGKREIEEETPDFLTLF